MSDSSSRGGKHVKKKLIAAKGYDLCMECYSELLKWLENKK